MRARTWVVLTGAVSLVLLSSGLVFAQAAKEAKGAKPQVSVAAAPAAAVTEGDLQWLWGEVVAVNSQSKEIKVKYIDYETDSEKEVSLYVDDKTTFENVDSLDAIKPQDGVSVDYLISTDGKFFAKNVSLEKTEDMEETGEVTTPKAESKPAAAKDASKALPGTSSKPAESSGPK